jgi:hypothetical protein
MILTLWDFEYILIPENCLSKRSFKDFSGKLLVTYTGNSA